MSLVLTRRIGESFEIGDDVVVTVLSTKGSQVKISVDAPKSVIVHRSEIAERIRAGQPAPLLDARSTVSNQALRGDR